MDEKDVEIQRLTRENREWKKRAAEACDRACFNCEEYAGRKKSACTACKISNIREAAEIDR